jgi:bilin biosynthesis protein
MSDKQDLSSLIKALASESKCFEAAVTLISLGGKAVEPLLAALSFDNWKIRGNAAWILGKLGDARAVEALIKALGDEVPEVRATAGGALINIGEPAIGPLQKFIEKGDSTSKGLAAGILSCIDKDDHEGQSKPDRRSVLKTA